MAFPKNTSQHVISTKRQLDRERDEFLKPKTVARKYPPPKIRICVKSVRDFPPGCGILQDSIENKVERKALKKLDIDNPISYVNDKTIDSQTLEKCKPNSYKPKELGFNKPSIGRTSPGKVKICDPKEQLVRDFPPVCGIKEERKKNSDNADSKLGFNRSFLSRPPGKVKFYDPNCSNDDNAQISKPIDTIKSQKDQTRRQRLREVMIMFDKVYTELSQENGSKLKGEKKSHCRIRMDATTIVKQKQKWMDPEKTLGQIRGVQPGDWFKFRAQLRLVGLHSKHLSGIDYTKINGKNLAISIVDSHRYSNISESSGELIYCGEGGGGVGFFGSNRQVARDDQVLERGNLALKNSMKEKNPVRVIRKVCGVGNRKNDVFVYDGLYTVNKYTQKRSLEGKLVFMFQLKKMPGQTQVQKRVNANGIPGDVVLNHYSTFQMAV